MSYVDHGHRHIAGGSDPIPSLSTASADVVLEIKVVDDQSEVTVGDGQFAFAISSDLNGWTLLSAHAYVTDASSSGLVTVQVRNVTNGNVDMLSTRVTIDVSEFTSYTAATPSVVNGTNAGVSTGDIIGIDVDVAGTVALGLGVILTFTP